MKRFSFLIVLFLILNSCELEDTITVRDYPFIEVIGVSSLDSTGVNIDFKILQSGRTEIESYGVEYSAEFFFNTVATFVEEIHKKPSTADVRVRLDSDLMAGKMYSARPFVKAGAHTVYGEYINFVSQGGPAPIVNNISISAINTATEFIITGDYFSSLRNGNTIQIPGLDKYFSVRVKRSSRKELTVDITKIDSHLPIETHEYDLILTAYNKSVRVRNQFHLDFPIIQDISPIKGHVGSSIEMRINLGSTSPQTVLLNNWVARFLPGTQDGVFKGIINDVSPGFYPIKYISKHGYSHQFPTDYEVLNSWKLEKTGNNGLDKFEFDAKFLVGDNILQVGQSWERGIYLFNYITDQKLKLKSREDIDPRRSDGLYAVVGNRYLYYGLGNRWEQNQHKSLKDFKRLDIITNEWETLPDLPLPLSGVRFAFEYQDKLWVVSSNYINFYFFNFQTQQWGTSDILIPQELRNRHTYVVEGDDIYFINSNNVFKYKIGKELTFISNLDGILDWSHRGIVKSNDILHIIAGRNHYQVDLTTNVVSRVQKNYEGEGDFIFPFIKDGNIWVGNIKYAAGSDKRTQLFRFDKSN